MFAAFLFADGEGEGAFVTDEDAELFGAGDGGVDEAALEENVVLGADGDDDAGELAALAFVNRQRIGGLELVELAGFVFDRALGIEADVQLHGIGVDGGDVADVAIEDLFVVVVVRLDDLVADAEGRLKALDLEFDLVGRIEGELQRVIQ